MNTYREPLGLPLKWEDEVSGELRDAVLAYYAHRIDTKKPFSAEQFELVRAYCVYYISAPCWLASLGDDNEAFIDLLKLIDDIGRIVKVYELSVWIQECLHLGIDPL
jgi:hypothetical protein